MLTHIILYVGLSIPFGWAPYPCPPEAPKTDIKYMCLVRVDYEK